MPDDRLHAATLRRYLSRHVIVDGDDRGLSLVTATASAPPRVIAVEPYEAETPDTEYLDTPIIITADTITSPPALP